MRLIASRVDFRNARPNLNLCRRVYNLAVTHIQVPIRNSTMATGREG
jgi:hypothetical protein